MKPLRILILLLICTVVISQNGCSWVTRDYSYVSSEITPGWKHQFHQGHQKSVKQVPVPDKATHIFDSENCSIEISAGYTITQTVGPFWFPVIPYSPISSKDKLLSINFSIISRLSTVIIDWSKVTMSVNNEISDIDYMVTGKPSATSKFIRNTTIDGRPVVEILPQSDALFILNTNVNPTDVDNLMITIQGVSAGGVEIPIPILNLSKSKGWINYDEFTL